MRFVGSDCTHLPHRYYRKRWKHVLRNWCQPIRLLFSWKEQSRNQCAALVKMLSWYVSHDFNWGSRFQGQRLAVMTWNVVNIKLIPVSLVKQYIILKKPSTTYQFTMKFGVFFQHQFARDTPLPFHFDCLFLQVLDFHEVKFKDYNVLEDDELREGIKKYSEWPTIPQVRCLYNKPYK